MPRPQDKDQLSVFMGHPGLVCTETSQPSPLGACPPELMALRMSCCWLWPRCLCREPPGPLCPLSSPLIGIAEVTRRENVCVPDTVSRCDL